jgi:hypothetical protein
MIGQLILEVVLGVQLRKKKRLRLAYYGAIVLMLIAVAIATWNH